MSRGGCERMQPLIELNGVTLSVPTYVQQERRASNWFSMFLSAGLDPPRRVPVEILKDVSMAAREGDRIAILGRNGAGKSTLLRVLNGVYKPTSGTIAVNGTRQALLNISLGFNNEATVRENIFLRGTAMGLRARDLRDHIDGILEFAGLQEKSSHRLRTLSSGTPSCCWTRGSAAAPLRSWPRPRRACATAWAGASW